jgi:hypothetical protein
MLQLKKVMGIAHHVCLATVTVVLKDVAHINHVCLPRWLGAVLDQVEREIGVPAVVGRFCEHKAVSAT